MKPLGDGGVGGDCLGRGDWGGVQGGGSVVPRNGSFFILGGSEILDFWNLAPREDIFFILGGLEILNFWNSAPREDCFFILVGGH